VKEEIVKALKELREKSKKRNFVQTVDLIVSLRDLDLKKPENRFTEDVFLPHGRGKEPTIVLISDSVREDVGCEILRGRDVEEIAKNKREAKKLAKRVDFFLAEPQLMPVIGKHLGRFLGPRNKMPKVVTGDIKAWVEKYKTAVRIKLKTSPVIQCAVGTEDMEDEKIAENVMSVLDFLVNKLPKGKNNIRKIFLKFTMSPAVEVKVKW